MDALGALPAGLDERALAAAVRAVLDPALEQGTAAGIGVSGGADSVALAHLAVCARPDVRWVVVHVRHGLRDDQADARAAAGCAAALGACYDERVVDVRLRPRTGVEAAARDARHAAFAAAAAAHGLAAVCLGHTADDRAETVLLNIGRGTGPDGLGALRPRRAAGGFALLRPLLRARRADVRAFAAGARLDWVEDPMNADPRFRRTRAREEVLPALARLSGGPGDPVGVLCRLADLAAGDGEVLDRLAAEEVERHVVAWGGVRAVRGAVLADLPPALGRRVVRMMLTTVRGSLLGVHAADVEAVRTLVPGAARTVAGGLAATHGQGWIAIAPVPPVPLVPRPLALPDGADQDAAPAATVLSELGLRLQADRAVGPPPATSLPPRAPGRGSGPSWACVPERAGMAVRSARAGDRVRTAAGTASVTRLLAGAGVPRPARAVVPVLVDAGDEVLWVPGVALREGVRGPLRVWLAPLAAGE